MSKKKKKAVKKKRKPRVRLNGRNFADPQYKEWRKKVYARDGYKCQWPGCCKKARLNAHHILRWAIYPTLRFEPGNGITLCYVHHDMVKGHEDDYIMIFQQILQNQLLQKVNDLNV